MTTRKTPAPLEGESPLLAHLRALFMNEEPSFEFTVDGWAPGGGALTLTATRLTLTERDKIESVSRAKGHCAAYAEIAVMKLKLEDGSPAFNGAKDKMRLMELPIASELQTIGDKLLYGLPNVETAEKNSEAPGSG